MNRKIIFSTLLSIAFVFLAATVVYANAKSCHGLTTIGYGNANISGGINWNSVRIEYTTSPFYFMDQIGATFWSSYNTCSGTINWDSYRSNSGYLAQNARSMTDVLYRQDYPCPVPGAVKMRVSAVTHWWQSSGFYGDGETTSKVSSLAPTFNDVPTNYWAYGWIEPMYQIGIMDIAAIRNGCPTTTFFCPSSSVTRAQMAYFLERGMRGSNFQFPSQGTGVFQDVPTNYWNASVIEQLSADGVTGGCYVNPLRFCPEDRVTRAQMAVFLLRAEHGGSYTPPAVGSSTGFSDVPVDYWAAAWIKQLYAEGITGGCIANPLSYCPDSWTSRDHMAVFLQRTFAP